jgi:G3E family GTPase
MADGQRPIALRIPVRTPIHLISGFLGAGKTTTLLRLLRARAGTERIAVLVNDVGTAGFDRDTLGAELKPGQIAEIEGGCVCCTAPAGFVDAIARLLDTQRPDRVIVEPTGLARPADLLDTLRRAPFADRLERMPTIVLVDPANLGHGDPTRVPIVREQLEAADVLVGNRVDRASDEALAAFRRVAAALWPAPMLVVETSFGALPDAAWRWPEARDRASSPRARAHDHDHHHDDVHGFVVRTLEWPEETRFVRERLVDAVARIAVRADAPIVRLKGVFATDDGWWRLEVAGGAGTDRPTAYRGGSRVDVIATSDAALDDAAAMLRSAIATEADLDRARTALELVTPSGRARFDRDRLAALPDQIADVSVIVPKRVGRAVPLREVLRAAGAPTDGQVVAVAHDGMTTAAAPLESLADAVLVYAHGDGPLPDDQGGPIRLLTPPHAAASACSNVKGLARLVLIAQLEDAP